MSLGTIIYVGGFELPDKDAAAHRVVGNANALKEIGYDVVFIDVDRSYVNNAGFAIKEIEGFTIYSVAFPNSHFQWFKYLTDINEIKKIISNRDDVKAIICYNYPSILLLKLIKYCRKNKVKIISDVTEWYEDTRFIKKIDTLIRMKNLNKKVDGLICISSYLDNYYKHFTNTVIVPPLIDLYDEKWNRLPSVPFREKINLIYSGRPGKHKDKLNIIIESLNSISSKKKISFFIVGITKKQYLEYYPEHANMVENLKDIVCFTGKISHSKSIELVKKSDFQIFIRESKRVNNAGFPTKFVESMACGTPVITTKTSDLGKYLINNKNGFFIDYIDNESLSIALNNIIRMERKKIIRMKEHCFNIDAFDYRCHTEKMNKFLTNIFETR
ncbi:glycosyltransferase family 4 protein [Acetobacterium wieringae]|uniref:Glycosyltransferase family 4 protein n=1 Tax=Acetobacterium wieringae TaxID=52694 RepID=A0A5D0WH45_9FIRM|nr:glycosyltransferase [Acetobacterium wieringae]TYC82203.1 glycosyltransferase family 4 protein [Acetobacterium wieringae]